MFACVATASLASGYWLWFEDAAAQKRYREQEHRLRAADDLARARAGLTDRGLLATIPHPDAGKPLSEQAPERICAFGRILLRRRAGCVASRRRR